MRLALLTTIVSLRRDDVVIRKDVSLPKDMQRSMAAEAEAERLAKAKVRNSLCLHMLICIYIHTHTHTYILIIPACCC